jgi:hypothetical protein
VCGRSGGGRAQSMPVSMSDADLAWVATRLHITVRGDYPKWGDIVEVGPKPPHVFSRCQLFSRHQLHL